MCYGYVLTAQDECNNLQEQALKLATDSAQDVILNLCKHTLSLDVRREEEKGPPA